MSRLTWVTAAVFSFAAGATAYAESQADIASKLNDEGKDAMYAQNFAAASAKFREAVARVPEPKYFFNLCTSLFQEGKFDEAVTACNAVGNNKPAPELQAKTDKLVGRIKDEAKSQGLELHPAGGGGGATDLPPNPGDPNNPPNPGDPNNPPNPGQPQPTATVGRAPTQGVFMAVKPDNRYTWSMGADILGGGGRIGQDMAYGNVFAGFRLKGDFVFSNAQRIGAQGYLQFSQFTSGNATVNAGTLQIIDVGAAVYKHICAGPFENLCLTPLIGAQVALMAPSADPGATDGSNTFYNYVAVGGRAELNAEFAFGRRQEHVLGAMIGINAYSPVVGGPSYDMKGVGVGLDAGGAALYVGLGYAYRFNTPLGGAAFVTLE